ncbi:hypothetical protein [Mesoterricola sediminis]|uniref:DUF3857 domain-containing protein n=1 Tax=Mesoterricola sediminis TaxID=2927980 RepID=A0AA48GX57_9BACT|nr:hypothetical protein [Mesoterricola sediminis]BDU77275.1 hypothetical protein METESE_22330 [Mesoterricola sediminis]
MPLSCRLRPAILCCLAALPAIADWPPIPPEVWALKARDLKGSTGALVLLDHLRVDNRFDTHHLRIRICSERGKDAVWLPPFPASLQTLEGRVVYPDGRELPLNGPQDLIRQTRIRFRTWEEKEHVLIPPGLTEDCLVDLRWQDLSSHREGRLDIKRPRLWTFSGPHPVAEVRLEIVRPASFTWTFTPDRTVVESRTDLPGFTVITLKDLPPEPPAPYSVAGARERPQLKVYPVLLPPSPSGRSLWDRLAVTYLQPAFKRPRTGARFDAFAQEACRDLPPGPQDRAVELALRMRERLRNFQAAGLGDAGDATLQELVGDVPAHDLERALERGGTSSQGTLLCFLELARRAGLQPHLVFGSDRDTRIFQESEPDLSQIERVLVRVQEAGKPDLFIDPAQPHLHPTLIDPAVQGSRVLEADPETWTVGTLTLPFQEAGRNWREDAYVVDLGAGEARFTLVSTFGGLAAYAAAAPFRHLEPREQGRELGASLEAEVPDLVVDRAEVQHGADVRQTLGLRVEGRIDAPAGRVWRLDPFPASQPALAIPQAWPRTREDLIVLPFAQVQRARCRLTLPEGTTCPDLPRIQRTNAWGSVTLGAALSGRDLTVDLEVRAERSAGGAELYTAFQAYLAWVQEAFETPLVLVRSAP